MTSGTGAARGVVRIRVGQTANIRRESPQFCEQGNRAAVGAIRDASASEAVKCESAKEELVHATSSEEADLASRKIELLCNG